MCLRRGWAREGQNEREKKEGKRWQWCWGGERRNLWKLNDERTSYESAGTSAPHTHTCSGHGCYSCVLCLCALCTHAWTHLPLPTNLCCVSVYFVCVREILARPLWFNPLLLCVCVCVHVHMCIFLYPIMKQCTVSVSQRVTCPQWQEPYCLVYESYACTPLVICFQMAITNHQSQLVCLLAHFLSTIADQMSACGLLVIRNWSVFQDFFSPQYEFCKFFFECLVQKVNIIHICRFIEWT